jgi:DNA-binding CsgD family transcriptional regulator
MEFDVIKAVEACYAGALDGQAWLSGLFDALSPLARECGFYAQIFRRDEDGSLSVESRLLRGIPPDALDEADRFFRSIPLEAMRRHWCPSPAVDHCLKRAGRKGGPLFGFMREMGRRRGMEDQFGIFAADPNGRTVGIFIKFPVGAAPIPPRVVHRLRSLAAHLTSALRLRCALSAEGGEAWGPAACAAASEAVLDPAGHTLDATGFASERTARLSLGAAVRLMEKARGRLRRTDPDEALQLWEGLVDGTWSLVEQHEVDGKRHLLARRNPPGLREPRALHRNERSVLAFAAMGHQNKYIGYLLGLSASAVSLHLRSAQRKLGLASRTELIRTFAGLVDVRRERAASASAS